MLTIAESAPTGGALCLGEAHPGRKAKVSPRRTDVIVMVKGGIMGVAFPTEMTDVYSHYVPLLYYF